MRLSLNFDVVILAFPSVLVYPKEGESNRCVPFRQWKVDKFDIDTRGGGSCVHGTLPVIVCPMQRERRTRLYAQAGAGRDRWHLTIEFPHLNRTLFAMASHVAIIC